MDNQFGVNLRLIRESKGMSQKELADAAGIPQASISNWEQGRRVPGWDSVMLLAKALEVSCEAFSQEVNEDDPRLPGRPSKPSVEEPPKKKKKGRPKT